MKIYVAYCHDRHVDPVIATFTTPEAACDFAREFMQENMANPKGITEETVEGHVLYLRYEYESDHAFVVETELDEPDED